MAEFVVAVFAVVGIVSTLRFLNDWYMEAKANRDLMQACLRYSKSLK